MSAKPDIILVGSKSDLYAGDVLLPAGVLGRSVSEALRRLGGVFFGGSYLETSSKSGVHVDATFHRAVQCALARQLA